MRPQIALDLNLDSIAVLSRAPADGPDAGRWWREGSVRLDAPDLAASIARLRARAEARAGQDFTSVLIIPDSQVLYTTIERDDRDAATTIRAALRGRTPYAVEDLAFAHVAQGDRLQVAVVALETLLEAETFAADHGFRPVAIVATPSDAIFPGIASFGPTGVAPELAQGAKIELDLGERFDTVPAPAIAADAPDEPSAMADALEDAAGIDDAPERSVDAADLAAQPAEAVDAEAAGPATHPVDDIAVALPVEPTPDQTEAEDRIDATPPDAQLSDTVATDAAPADVGSSDVGSPADVPATAPVLPSFSSRRVATGTAPATGEAPAVPRVDRIAPRLTAGPVAPPRAKATTTTTTSTPPLAEVKPSTDPAPDAPAMPIGPVMVDSDISSTAEPATAQPTDAAGQMGAGRLDQVMATAKAPASSQAEETPPPAARGRRPAGLILTGGLVAALLAVGGLSMLLPDDGDTAQVAAIAPAEERSPERLDLTETEAPAAPASAPTIAPAATEDRAETPPRIVDAEDTAALLPDTSMDSAASAPAALPPVPVGIAPPAGEDAPQRLAALDAGEDATTTDAEPALPSASNAPTPTDEPGEAVEAADDADPDEDIPAPVQIAAAGDTTQTDPEPAAALVAPSPDGTVAPGGYAVVAGRPDVLPRPRPADTIDVASSDEGADLPATEEVDPAEVAARRELARTRPVRRPADAPVDAVATEDPSGDAPSDEEIAEGDEADVDAETTEVAQDTADEAAIPTDPAALTLGRFKPRPRPDSIAQAAEAAAQEEAEAERIAQAAAEAAEAAAAVSAASQAAAASLASVRADARVAATTGPVSRLALPASERPQGRPRSVEQRAAQIVAQRRAQPAAPVRTAAISSAPAREPAAPATTRQTLRASPNTVARAATDRNALRLNQMNLIGVYGQPSARRALVRMGNGRYVKVQVGDRLDRGRVTAIGANQVSYQRGGRNIVLRMPNA